MTAQRLAAVRLVEDPLEVRAQIATTLRAIDREIASLWRAHQMNDPLNLQTCADLVQNAGTLIMLSAHSGRGQ